MFDYHDEYARSIAITISFSIYTLVLYGITWAVDFFNEGPVLHFIMVATLDILSFTLIYKVVDELYDKLAFRYINKVDNLEDKWFVIHIPKTMNLSEYRFGEVAIDQSYFRIFANARNYGTEIKVKYDTNNKENGTGDIIPVKDYLRMMEKEIEDIIQEYNSNEDYSSDARYACREKIGIVVKRAKGAFIIIDTDVHARSTVWRYEIARIDPDRSYIYGMFYAHSDKPISNMKSLCDDCKTTVKKCDRCHDYDTEVDSIDQETHRYGGHIIKVDQNLHESFFVRHAKRLIELDGEYHNMLPNKTGEGRLWFVRQRREVIESSYMPPDMIHLAQYYRKSRTGIFVRKVGSKIRKAVKMDPRNEYGGLFTAEELGVIRKSKRLEIVLEKVVDELEKHMVENLESDIHSTKITKGRLYIELAKLVTVNRMKEYVKDGIDHNLKSFVKKAEMKMNLEKKTYSADLYDKNKNPVGRVVPMSVFPDNYYRLAVHVYVFSETGYVRMTDADSQFVKIEGYVRSGETNFEAASRILFEHTGIQRRINENNIAISQTKDMLMEDHFVYKILPGDNFSGDIKVDLEPTESFEEYCSESGIIVDTEVITAVRMKSKEL